MSFALDANILIYAAQADSPHHERAASFLRACATGDEAMYLPWPVLMGFLRIVTHPSLFRNPLPMTQALANIEALMAQPHVRTLGENERFAESLRAACETGGIRGALVSDAHVAALLHAHGIRTLYTNDADFRRFPFLVLRNPLE